MFSLQSEVSDVIMWNVWNGILSNGGNNGIQF